MTRSIIRILIIDAIILLIALLIMQFTDELSWSPLDFAFMGLLVFVAGTGIELSLKKLANPLYRVIVCAAIFTLALLVWAEAAVGIFGTPFAGS